MSARVSHTTVNATDAVALSQWWKQVLGYRDVEDLDPRTNPTSIHVFVDELDVAHRALVGAGFEPTPNVETSWGLRESSVRDPSGNLIRLGCASRAARAGEDERPDVVLE